MQPVKAGRSTLVPHVADSSSALVTSSEPHVMAVCLESDHAAILKEHFEMSTEMESSSEFQAIWQEPGMKAILRPVLLASKAYHAIIQEHADFPKVRERVSKYESKKADIRIVMKMMMCHLHLVESNANIIMRLVHDLCNCVLWCAVAYYEDC